VISRFLLALFLTALMLVTGVSTYLYENSRQTKLGAAPLRPTDSTPSPHAFVLPGTLYVAQSGAIYSLSNGRFHQLTNEAGWMQPSMLPDGNLLVVRRTGFYSDIYEISRFGKLEKQLTFNGAPRRSYDTGDNHWSFYPRVTADGRTLFMSYDEPKGGYEVDMSIWSMPLSGNIRQGTDWSYSQGYTGGDVQPVPVPGGLMYTKYLRAADGSIASQLWFTNRPNQYQLYAGKALTSQDEDCRSPNLSPDGRYIAMICTFGKQISQLEIATWSGSSLGPRQVVIMDQMVAQPTWAPDASGIAYFAPGAPDAPFQLWFIQRARYFPPAPSPIPTPSAEGGGPVGTPEPSASPTAAPPPPIVKPIQVTTLNGFDAASTMAWAP
jgi:Tol biopolymer transport system component